MENIVYTELLVRGYSVDVGVVEVNQKNRIRNTIHLEIS